jgi:hypothetical protein
MAGVPLATEDWQSLLEDPEGRAPLFPIVTLGSRKAGNCLRQVPILTRPSRPRLDDLVPSVIAISRYWPGGAGGS